MRMMTYEMPDRIEAELNSVLNELSDARGLSPSSDPRIDRLERAVLLLATQISNMTRRRV